MGQNRIRGGWGVQKPLKMWDIIYVRSLRELAQSSLLGKITRNNFTPNRYMHNIHANISIHSTLPRTLQSSLKINNLDTYYFIR